MTDVRLKISPPWITHLNQIEALFIHDPDISIHYDEEDYEIKLCVNNAKKAGALNKILPPKKEFGNITLFITIVPENGYKEVNDSIEELFDIAFENNPIYSYTKTVAGMWAYNHTYVVFKNKVVQFFNDNLLDIHGNISTLYQEIAKDVFEGNEIYGVSYCTDIEEKVGMPLGEWP